MCEKIHKYIKSDKQNTPTKAIKFKKPNQENNNN